MSALEEHIWDGLWATVLHNRGKKPRIINNDKTMRVEVVDENGDVLAFVSYELLYQARQR